MDNFGIYTCIQREMRDAYLIEQWIELVSLLLNDHSMRLLDNNPPIITMSNLKAQNCI